MLPTCLLTIINTDDDIYDKHTYLYYSCDGNLEGIISRYENGKTLCDYEAIRIAEKNNKLDITNWFNTCKHNLRLIGVLPNAYIIPYVNLENDL